MTDPQNALGQAFQGLLVQILCPAKIVDYPGGGKLFLLIPDILGQLIIGNRGAILILGPSLSQIHAQYTSMYYHAMSRDKPIFMCL